MTSRAFGKAANICIAASTLALLGITVDACDPVPLQPRYNLEAYSSGITSEKVDSLASPVGHRTFIYNLDSSGAGILVVPLVGNWLRCRGPRDARREDA